MCEHLIQSKAPLNQYWIAPIKMNIIISLHIIKKCFSECIETQKKRENGNSCYIF